MSVCVCVGDIRNIRSGFGCVDKSSSTHMDLQSTLSAMDIAFFSTLLSGVVVVAAKKLFQMSVASCLKVKCTSDCVVRTI